MAIVKIPGLSGRYAEVPERYDYEGDRSRCPVCGNLGMPWAGWFSCEGCTAKALVSNGRTFVRLEEPRDE
jgi:hypothetical protein